MAPHKPAQHMTANPVRPGRYRPGKPVAEEQSSDEDEQEAASSAVEEGGGRSTAQVTVKPAAVPPRATSFPKGAVASLQSLDLDERRRRDMARERERLEVERNERERREREAGFVTESEEDGEEDEEDEEEEGDNDVRARPAAILRQQRTAGSASEEEEDSGSSMETSSGSDTASRRPPPRPMFIKKGARADTGTATSSATGAARFEAERMAAAEEEKRKRKANDALIQSRIDAEAALKAAGQRAWDEVDLTGDGAGSLDDTDDLEPELERREWIARELARLKRSRAALKEREAEIAEVERRRDLGTPEREEEDRRRLEEQREAKESKGKAGFMARYHHHGAFFGDAQDKDGNLLAERDLMGAEYEGQVGVMEALPKYLQVRDQTSIGRKGRQRHRDLKSEDTGRWGEFGDGRGGGGAGRRGVGGAGGAGAGATFVQDERFRPDRPGEGAGGGVTGANASRVQERKRPGDGLREDDSKRARREEVR